MRNESFLVAYRSARVASLATTCLLLVPLLAMQFTGEVRWGIGDFLVAGSMLFCTIFTYMLIAGRARNTAYQAAIGLTLAAVLLLVWVNLAVGILGTPRNPSNLMYVGVLAVGIAGSVLARLHARGMMRALLAMACVQALVTVAVLLGAPHVAGDGLGMFLVANGFFIALFTASAWLFRRAAGVRAA